MKLREMARIIDQIYYSGQESLAADQKDNSPDCVLTDHVFCAVCGLMALRERDFTTIASRGIAFSLSPNFWCRDSNGEIIVHCARTFCQNFFTR